MTKSQLIDQISQRALHVPRREIEAIVNAVFDTLSDGLRREERIEVRGFGSFSVRVRNARTGRNPKTGATVHVPARKSPAFTPGKELKDRLNPGEAFASETSRPAGHDEPHLPASELQPFQRPAVAYR
ncbi:MAG: HU family DNA-binding protein [Myxococcaceae bacterium]